MPKVPGTLPLAAVCDIWCLLDCEVLLDKKQLLQSNQSSMHRPSVDQLSMQSTIPHPMYYLSSMHQPSMHQISILHLAALNEPTLHASQLFPVIISPSFTSFSPKLSFCMIICVSVHRTPLRDEAVKH